MIMEERHDMQVSNEIDSTDSEEYYGQKKLPPDFDEDERKWQREQMKARIKYINKNYKYFKK